MKLIIDIREEKYRHITEMPNVYGSEICEVIRNGTPYEDRPQGEWIPVSERLPEGKMTDYDFNEVLCSTTWRDVRAYKFGRPLGYDKPHFWFGGNIMDGYVVAWQPLPEPYKREAENDGS